MPAPPWLTTRPIAHRGLHDSAAGVIENTATAAEAAIAGGYTVECDVHLAADGVVVFHDATLDRLTRSTGPVAGYSVAELGKVKLRGTGDRILTLDEFLAIVDGRADLLVEIKTGPDTPDRALETHVVKSLLSYDGPVAAMSFSPHIVGRLKDLAPALPRGLVSGHFKHVPANYGLTAARKFRLRHLLDAPWVLPHFIAYDVRDLPSLAPSLLRRFGLPILAWTVKTQEHRETAKAHADQIIFEGFRPED
ncbi:Glycerophosphoryl diester phosphodiesterase [hydrothermal vent metagenome]|uniref:Glycerophosphoryl diester phosphodiesterase n=1 Tax=hydrothermal vent metagenome TaxID=652676 RepID=A0A3B0TKF6_9ZZZZ